MILLTDSFSEKLKNMAGRSLLVALATVSSFSNVFAHPGEYHAPRDVAREMEHKMKLAEIQYRDMNACEGSFDVEARRERAFARRAATVERLRKERGIETGGQDDSRILRSFADLLENSTDHTWSNSCAVQ